MSKHFSFLIFILVFLSLIVSLIINDTGKRGADVIPLNANVLILYNDQDSESIEVADYYAMKRNIPSVNKCRLSIPLSKVSGVNIADFEALIKEPTRACLDVVGRDNVFYVVMSYKLPFQVTGGFSPLLSPEGLLADIWDQTSTGYYGASSNPYAAYSSSKLNSFQAFVSLKDYRGQSYNKKIYSVWRLDAGSKDKAKGLIDRAIYAEQNGLIGQGCFDVHSYGGYPIDNIPDSGYGMGDWNVIRAKDFLQKAGFPTTYDDKYDSIGVPGSVKRCDGAAFYAGWYNYNNYLDAFTWNPGSIGWDINSASATSPRSGSNWCFQAIERGLTACTGSITEPYLTAITNYDGAFRNLFEGANLGDAVYRNSVQLRWVMLYIGDPLYRPFPNGLAPFNSVTPSTPTKLVINGTKSVKSGLCTGLSVNTSDSDANISLLNKSIAVNMAASAGGFYSDPNCTTTTYSLQVGLSSINPTIYFKASGPMSVTISASTNEQGIGGASYAVSITDPFPISIPYNGIPFVAGEIFQAMKYDKGGSSSAFYDLTALDDINHDRYANSYPLLRPEEDWVEICACNSTYICSSSIDTSYSVGGTFMGEWINYSINLAPGRYKISSKVSSSGEGGKYHFELSESISTEQIIVPNTTAWNNYFNIDSSEFSIETQGTYRMKLVFDRNGSGTDNSGAARAKIVGRFSTFEVISLSSDQPPVIGAVPAIHAYPYMAEAVSPSVVNGNSYAWVTKNTPSGGTITYSSNSVLSPSVTANAIGEYILTLTATNTNGSSTKDVSLIVHKFADISGDGNVDFQDFSALLGSWGSTSNPMANIDRVGSSATTVDFQDFSALLRRWGT